MTLSSALAIIGFAGRFPGAGTTDAFWTLIQAGRTSIRRFTVEEAVAEGLSPDEARNPRRVLAGGILDDVDLFDHLLFRRSPREAELTDPQQRILLECAWQALEHAGYAPRECATATGVFVGGSRSTYRLHNLAHLKFPRGSVEEYQVNLGNDSDYLASRIAYHLGLEGAAVNVQMACATSLAAVHLAAQALLAGECDQALAGGVSIMPPQKAGYVFSPEGILSEDGNCRPFTEDAGGAVPGEAVGVVVLKRLEEAIQDGDNIWAIIRGSALTNDGNAKAGFTAPSPHGQVRCLAQALAFADVAPNSIEFVETHGTGTALGDRIELEALLQVYSTQSASARCALGAVKALIGHCDAAAGIVALIKGILALHHRCIPPQPSANRPSVAVAGQRHFYLPTQAQSWQPHGHPRRCAVSSFGLGGNNVSVVLEEGPGANPRRIKFAPHRFQRQRFWISPMVAEAPSTSETPFSLYEPDWEPTILASQQREGAIGQVLLIGAPNQETEDLRRHLELLGGQVSTACSANDFRRTHSDRWELRVDLIDDWKRLFAEYRQTSGAVETVVHALPLVLGSTEEQAAQLRAYSHLRNLARTLHDLPHADARIIIVGRHLQNRDDSTGNHAAVAGLCHVLRHEYPAVSYALLDVGLEDSTEVLRTSLPHILRVGQGEWCLSPQGLWRRVFRRLNPHASHRPSGGHYLITGGTFGIGAAIADWLASSEDVRLTLLVDDNCHPEMNSRAEERAGTLRARLNDLRQTSAAIDEAISRFGPLKGVVHASRIFGEAFTVELNVLDGPREKRYFDVALAALINLQLALKGREPERFIVCSSLSAILGSFGAGPYAAAAAAMDAFVRRQSSRADIEWRTINLEAWDVDRASESDLEALPELRSHTLSRSDGQLAFQAALAVKGKSQVVISRGDLPERYRRWVTRRPVAKAQTEVAVLETGSSDRRGRLMQVWRDLLRVECIQPTDSFFSLGGDSLQLLQLGTILRTEYFLKFPLRELIQHATFRDMSQWLDQQQCSLGSADSDMPAITCATVGSASQLHSEPRRSVSTPIPFSLYFFSGNVQDPHRQYQTLLDYARLADDWGFHAIWIPERHMHSFGGIFPNPSVLAAAIAAVTRKIGIRAGSIVLPLHHPLRVVEEWAVVDQLSRGRVGLGVASGWKPEDFVLSSTPFADRHSATVNSLQTIRRLWSGEEVSFKADGTTVAGRAYPPPYQSAPPLWLTGAGSQATFRLAGELGTGILTHLLGQDLEQLAGKIQIYRDSFRESGPMGPRVTVLLHTFLGENDEQVKSVVKEPFLNYLDNFLALTAPSGSESTPLSRPDRQDLLEVAFARYFETSAFLGTPAKCRNLAERLAAIGVDEFACLIDFVPQPDLVRASLEILRNLQLDMQRNSREGDT